MIISKTAITKWNPKTKKYYESLGYSFTKMNDEFEVLVEHLTQKSLAEITLRCDYCDSTYISTMDKRNRAFILNPKVKKDVCKSNECLKKKIRESKLIRNRFCKVN